MDPIIECRKTLEATHIDRSGNSYPTTVEAGWNYEVDAYVDHRELDVKIKERCAKGWDCIKILECAPMSAGDGVTLFWRK